MKPTLLVLAAGMGSRYGGLKQLDGVGPSGETIMEFSIYDAIKAGFGKVVFVIRKSFEQAYGSPDEFTILALLPNYLERKDSSLVSMIDQFLKTNNQAESGFYLYDYQALYQQLKVLEAQKKPTLLIGVSFALLDFFEAYNINLKHTIVMETGGMKGRRKELTRTALHQILKDATGLQNIHSEYGMTELRSQAYATADGVFRTPPWMKIHLADTDDLLSESAYSQGLIKIIDLANLYSMPFIQTQDLGRRKEIAVMAMIKMLIVEILKHSVGKEYRLLNLRMHIKITIKILY